MIQIKGVVYSTSVKNNLGMVVLSTQENPLSTVICHFPTEEIKSVKNIKQGETVTIKGICTGFLMDVVLIKCMVA